MPKYQKLEVEPYTDEPMCMKCLRKKGQDNGVDFYYDRILDLFNMYCQRCGFRWWMEPAYQTWEELHKHQYSGG